MNRVNPYFGWGFDTDPVSGEEGLWNLTEQIVKERMVALLRCDRSTNAYTWSKETSKSSLRNFFMGVYMHKKRANWDTSIHAWFIKSKKKGIEIRVELPS